jgi:hypothetical protein
LSSLHCSFNAISGLPSIDTYHHQIMVCVAGAGVGGCAGAGGGDDGDGEWCWLLVVMVLVVVVVAMLVFWAGHYDDASLQDRLMS